MKAESLPCWGQWVSAARRHTLTVGEIREALKDIPDDAFVKFADGGFLEAPGNAAWGEVELKERRWPWEGRYVETCWE